VTPVRHERHVSTLHQGDPFRDWLASVLDGRLPDPSAPARVSLIRPASHTVCLYRFPGGPAVIAKFFAEPTGANHRYDPEKAMKSEFRLLRRARKAIPVAEPISMRKEFNCVLVTSFVPGTPLSACLRDDPALYGHLTGVAALLRNLHLLETSPFRKEREFSNIHDVLDQNRLPADEREHFNRLLGAWWHSGDLDRDRGCMIHRDATPANYIFSKDGIVAIDFESAWTGAHPVHDPGIFCAEMKFAFRRLYGNPDAAEPYIGHFLWNYARSRDEFAYVTRCVPFYMGLGYLRMARLVPSREERDWLLQEAMLCLKRR
jgi:aminoglycoside phosphotransferase (APT) family kinase protein